MQWPHENKKIKYVSEMISEFQTFQNHLLNQLIQNQDIITSWESRASGVARMSM
jgi:hypothetical protein